MADRRRIVTLSPGGRPIVELDMEVTSSYQSIRDTFAYQPGAQNPLGSREPGRYGGQNAVGEANDNGTVTWQALVRGATPDVCAANIEALLAAANRTARGRLLEWRPDGSTFSSYFRISGPGMYKPTYSWAQWQGAQSMVMEISFPARPLVLWDKMTIGDPFDVDSGTDYTFDASAVTDIAISSGTVQPVVGAALSAERRSRHTARGYQLLEGQATVKTTPGSTITSYKAGVILRASAASTYVEVYVDDNGVSSRLRIDVIIAGVRTNQASTNLGGRISNGNPLWIRGRIEDQKVIAEHFTVVPTPMGAPATTNNYTLSGGEQTTLVAGYAGWSWVPQHASARLDDFEFLPYTWRNLSLPQAIATLDTIPGSAPALADVLVTPSGSSSAPIWALIGWGRNPGLATPPSVFEAEAVTLSGWASSAQAGASGGFDARASTSGAGTFSLSANITISAMELDDFTDGQVDVEVWARVLLSSTLVNPRMAVFNVGSIATSSTQEFGSAGKLLTKPSAGSVYRFTRLGVLTLDASSSVLKIQGTVEAGSSGVFGVDNVIAVLARRRAAVITGVASTDVAPFVPFTSEVTKQIRSDLATQAYFPSSSPERTAGVGGSLIQPSPASNRWVIKLSTLIPDDPTVSTATEELAHPATVSLDVTPRSYMLRGA